MKNVSASQVNAFKTCNRIWYLGWVEKLKSPKTAAQQRGTDIHTEIEHYLTTGNVRDSSYPVLDDEAPGAHLLDTKGKPLALNYRPYVDALVPFLPPPQHPELIIEHGFSLDLFENHGIEIPWDGYVDLGFSGTGWPLLSELSALFQFSGSQWPAATLGDVKSISDFRYCKKPEELKRDTQLCSYGAWAIGEGHRGSIALGHYYVLTEKKRVPKKVKVLPRFVEVTEDEVLAQFEEDLDVVREMVAASSAPTVSDVKPTGAAKNYCSKLFGKPCPHRARCGFDVQQRKGTLTMGFMDKFKGKNGNETAPQPAVVPQVVPQAAAAEPAKGGFMNRLKAAGLATPSIPTGTLPPDAPPRETPAARQAAPVQETAAPAEEKKPRAKRAKGRADGMTLYLGCAPRKGGGDITIFEDFIAPVIAELNEYVKKEKDLSSYRFLDFSEEKALFAMAVADKIPTIVGDLVVLNKQSAEWRDAMTAIVPHAAVIVE